MAFLQCYGAYAASVDWKVELDNQTGFYVHDPVNGGFAFLSDVHIYSFTGVIHGGDGRHADINSPLYGHDENGNLLLHHNDFSLEMDPTFNWWVLADYGEVIGEESFTTGSSRRIEDIADYDYFTTGGTKVENPSDFYMAFKVSEVIFVSGVGYEEGETWYGWVHVSVDDELNMTLLGEGINLYGGPVVVGAIPEPSAGVLLLLGLAGLALRRRPQRG